VNDEANAALNALAHPERSYHGWIIRTGFLAGNLFDGGEWESVDQERSAARYAAQLELTLALTFPGATVEVPYELRAVGVLPAELQTYVHVPRPPDDPDGFRDENLAAELVENMATTLYDAMTWLVFQDGSETEGPCPSAGTT
jgi:hypothetical protein